MNWWEPLVTLAVAAVPAAVAYVLGRRKAAVEPEKVRAEAAAAVSEAASNLVNELQEEDDRLRERLAGLQGRIEIAYNGQACRGGLENPAY